MKHLSVLTDTFQEKPHPEVREGETLLCNCTEEEFSGFVKATKGKFVLRMGQQALTRGGEPVDENLHLRPLFSKPVQATANLTIKGKLYNVSLVDVPESDKDIATPYVLTPDNGKGKTWRLLRNQRDPSLLFPVCGVKCGDFWLREAGEGELIPVC